MSGWPLRERLPDSMRTLLACGAASVGAVAAALRRLAGGGGAVGGAFAGRKGDFAGGGGGAGRRRPRGAPRARGGGRRPPRRTVAPALQRVRVEKEVARLRARHLRVRERPADRGRRVG